MGDGRKSEEPADDSLEPPAGVADPLLWRSAQRVLVSHSADLPGKPCPACGADSPCPPRQLAERAIAVARDAALPTGLPKLPAGSGGPALVEESPALVEESPALVDGNPTPAPDEPESAKPAPTPPDAAAAAGVAASVGTAGDSAPGDQPIEAASALPRPRTSAPKGRRPSPRARTVTA